MTKIFIPYQFTTLNKYIAALNRNRYIGNNIKKKETEVARLHFIGKKFDTPCKIHLHWVLKDKRTDLDNIQFSTKYILDGMVKAKAIPDDSLKYVVGISHSYEIDKTNVGVCIEVIE